MHLRTSNKLYDDCYKLPNTHSLIQDIIGMAIHRNVIMIKLWLNYKLSPIRSSSWKTSSLSRVSAYNKQIHEERVTTTSEYDFNHQCTCMSVTWLCSRVLGLLSSFFPNSLQKKERYNLPCVYLQMGIMQYQLLSILCMLITTKCYIFTTCVSFPFHLFFPPQQKDGNKYYYSYYSYYSKRNPCKRRRTCTIMTRLYIKTISLTIH